MVRERKKKYYDENRDKALNHKKEYYEANKEKNSERSKQYYEANKEIKKVKIPSEVCNLMLRKDCMKNHLKNKH